MFSYIEIKIIIKKVDMIGEYLLCCRCVTYNNCAEEQMSKTKLVKFNKIKVEKKHYWIKFILISEQNLKLIQLNVTEIN